MEAVDGSMSVTVSYAALTCAGETLASMFLSALVKTHFLALNSLGLLLTNKTGVKGDNAQNQPKPEDADGEDDGEDDDDGDGGFGEGEEELSSEEGEDYGNNPNSNKNNPKKGPGASEERPFRIVFKHNHLPFA
ncbi:hypothetical protein COLO4_11040 [Corchorus olitorius]|uniref:Uncharacterized protein n=1 Tax=Corchorus olitorius TaxID=93759 RepID=A0A1R3K625_9ROSI|nr:hypothetical protein COLO4_11040 [Corchorus olitorius]